MDKRDLSDREILLLIDQKIDEALPIINKRLDAHAADIKELRKWRYYLGGAFAAVAAYLGIRMH